MVDSEQVLGDALRASVPELPPQADGWADAARRAALIRRHRARAGVAAATLLVVGGAGWFQMSRHVVPAVPMSGPTSTNAASCTGLPKAETSGRQLPDGPAMVRLCPPEGTPDPYLSPQAPAEALASDSQALVDHYNGLPKTSRSMLCTADAGPVYRMAFGYPDGRMVVVDGDSGGCGVVGGRLGAEELGEDFVARLTQQRITTPAPTVTVTTDPCTLPPTSWLPVDTGHLQTAAVCREAGHVGLDGDTVALLERDLATGARARYPGNNPMRVSIVDRHGQPQAYFVDGDVAVNGHSDQGVRLSAATVRAITAAVDRADGPVAAKLCGQKLPSVGDIGSLSRGADCTDTPRLLGENAVGSLGKLATTAPKPGVATAKGTRRLLKLDDGHDKGLQMRWIGTQVEWQDTATGAVQHADLPPEVVTLLQG